MYFEVVNLPGVVLLAGMGYLFCALPGIYLYVLFLFAWPAVVLEGRGVSEALSRSVFLVSGNWWRVFGTMLLLGLIGTKLGGT